MIRLLLLLSLALVSCSPDSLDDYHREGEATTKQLVKELRQVHSREDLIVAEPHLRELFSDLVATALAAEEYRAAHPRARPSRRENQWSGRLQKEMLRIYNDIDDAREIVESSQSDAINILDSKKQQG